MELNLNEPSIVCSPFMLNVMHLKCCAPEVEIHAANNSKKGKPPNET